MEGSWNIGVRIISGMEVEDFRNVAGTFLGMSCRNPRVVKVLETPLKWYSRLRPMIR